MRTKVAASAAVVVLTLAALAATWLLGGHDGGRAVQSPAAAPAASSAPGTASGPSSTGPGSSTAVPVPRRPATPAPVPAVDPPVRVVAEEVQIDARVVPVGIAADGQMEIPPDPDVMGWYSYGPPPGAPDGSVVLGGHLDSRRYGVGPLARLKDSEVGDAVVVTSAAGTESRYRISTVDRVPRGDARLADYFRRSGPHQLVLITCGGEYDAARGGYQENLVVIGVPD